METSRRQLCTLMAVCWTLASASAMSDSIDRHDFPVHAEIAGEACKFTDPSDPHQILGPNPAHGDCLTALYPAAIPSGSFMANGATEGGDLSATSSGLSPSLTSLWLAIAAVAMLVLAGFNSRKRHRQLPTPGVGGSYGRPTEPLHTHSEGSRWNED
jgi:hypothetical protein